MRSVGRSLVSIRSRVGKPLAKSSGEAPRVIDSGPTAAGVPRAVELTPYSACTSKLPSIPASRGDGAGNITINVVAALPAGWTERKEEGTGCAYFTNEVTGETSWTPPSGD